MKLLYIVKYKFCEIEKNYLCDKIIINCSIADKYSYNFKK